MTDILHEKHLLLNMKAAIQYLCYIKRFLKSFVLCGLDCVTLEGVSCSDLKFVSLTANLYIANGPQPSKPAETVQPCHVQTCHATESDLT